MTETLLTREDVAKLLSVSVRTLDDWRLKRKGPPWVRMEGGVRYRESELREWLAKLETVSKGRNP